jgi:hypothetical protein
VAGVGALEFCFHEGEVHARREDHLPVAGAGHGGLGADAELLQGRMADIEGLVMEGRCRERQQPCVQSADQSVGFVKNDKTRNFLNFKLWSSSTMTFGTVTFQGERHLRHRLLLSLLSGRPIKIEKIRPNRSEHGLKGLPLNPIPLTKTMKFLFCGCLKRYRMAPRSTSP